ncbi:MAG: ABC transporter permease [Acidimicrobiales bacterium]
MKHVRLVAGRDLMESFRARSYWFTIGLFMVIVAGGIIIPRLIDSDTTYHLGLTGDVPTGLEADLETLVAAFDAELELTIHDDRDAATTAVDEGDDSVAVAFEPDETFLIRRDDSSETLVGIVNQAVSSASARQVLDGAGLEDETITAALAPTPPTEVRVDDEESGRAGVAWLTGLVLYLAIFMGGMSVAQGVAIEKSTRIAEVLVTTVRPAHLLAGKVLGLGVSVLIILCAGAIPFAAAIAGGWVDVPDAAALDVLAAIGWFVLGYAVYAVAFGSLGALVDRQEDLGTAVGPLSAILVLSYLATIQAAEDPGSTIARVISIIPFSAPMVMPVRIGAGAASGLEIAAAVGLGIVTVVVLARVGGTIYRKALLRGGQRLKVHELLRA